MSTNLKHFNMLYTTYSCINDQNIPSTPSAILITNNSQMPTNRAMRSCKKQKESPENLLKQINCIFCMHEKLNPNIILWFQKYNLKVSGSRYLFPPVNLTFIRRIVDLFNSCYIFIKYHGTYFNKSQNQHLFWLSSQKMYLVYRKLI